MNKKLLNLLKIIFYVKIQFKNPDSRELIIFDTSDIDSLKENILKKFNYFIFEDRIHLLTKIYFSLDILKIIFFYRKYGFKLAYKIAIIKIVNPKLIFTFIHNSESFSNLAKILSKEFNFLALQNGSTYYQFNEANFLHQKYKIRIKKFYVPHLLCLSKLDINNYIKEKKVKVDKYETTGSLRLENFKSKFKKKIKLLKKDKFDICLLSDAGAWHLKEPELNKKFAKLIKFVIRYTLEENKKLVLPLKRPFIDDTKNIPTQAKSFIKGYYNEINWYKKYLNSEEYDYLKKKFIFKKPSSNFFPYTSYKASVESKVTIAAMSTMLREVFSMKKKILACNLTSNNVYDFPITGISAINFECDYMYFKKKLNHIFKISKNNYFKEVKISNGYDLEENKKNNTIKKIISIIEGYLKNEKY